MRIHQRSWHPKPSDGTKNHQTLTELTEGDLLWGATQQKMCGPSKKHGKIQSTNIMDLYKVYKVQTRGYDPKIMRIGFRFPWP